MTNSFTCTLIGSDTLLIECGQTLLDQGHQVLSVITDAERVEVWATERGLPVLHPKADDLVPALTAQPYDYLFAITHLAIIKDDVLATAGKMAINFHDGPLPRYAGLNTPAHALIAGENTYGISWHEMISGIDEGDLLKQVLFDLAPNETSLSLNTRNFAAAMESFEELARELATGSEKKAKQEGERENFGRHDRPTAAAVLDFARPAQELEALVRGLDFGTYANPVGAATLVHDGQAVVVKSAETRDETRDETRAAVPGTVIEVDEAALVVATGAGAIAFTKLSTLTGAPLTIAEAASALILEVGDTISGITPSLRDDLSARSQALSKAERFWLRRLNTLEPLELPWLDAAEDADAAKSGSSLAPDTQSLAVSLPASFTDRYPGQDARAALIALYLGRVGGKADFHLGHASNKGKAPLLSAQIPLAISLDWTAPFAAVLRAWQRECEEVAKRETFLVDLLSRQPTVAGRFAADQALLPVSIDLGHDAGAPLLPGTAIAVRVGDQSLSLDFDPARYSAEKVEAMAEQIATLSASIAADGDGQGRPVGQLNLLNADLRLQMLETWNRTEQEVEDVTIDELFARQVATRPDDIAVRCEGQALTYRELDLRAAAVAEVLLSKGAGPDQLVGVHVDRSLELMVSVLGVLKAGAAYVPLDPSYPRDRITYMVEHAQLTATLTRPSLRSQLPTSAPNVINVDDVKTSTASPPAVQERDPASLAYVIYTSGSTGRPKGVMIEHRQAVNFFVGMDAVVPHEVLSNEKPGVWLAVTSLSFDISVLELLWTLTRGFEVLIYRDRAAENDAPKKSKRHIDFGLFYWGNDDGEGRQKYKLLLDGARFADANGFNSVWTPERHFHAFGGPYPNPAVTGAAVAAVTSNLSVRSGSCVVPLHHPARIAEEWAVIDNLSDGRAALSIAAGWQPDDFLLRPENYPGNKQAMFDSIEIVRRLWRGEKVTFKGPMGDIDVLSQPRPVQKELPIWLTTAGNPVTYKQAADLDANVLTHLLGQSVDEVAGKVIIYRDALEANGKDRESGTVTLMLHCFVGDDTEAVRAIVREPMKDYLRASVGLVKSYAWTFPAFKRPEGATSPLDVDLTTLTEEETEAILDFAFERYFEDSGLFGDVETCLKQVERLKAIGIDEIGCLVDFGVETQVVLDMLPKLAEVLRTTNDHGEQTSDTEADADAETADYGLAALVERHHVTHMQCTPSMARMLTADTDTKQALGNIDHLFVGGEAFPLDLALELKANTRGTVRNMYGPTETTIWSSTEEVQLNMPRLPIGQPIANTRLYILNALLEPQPVGVPGDLFIGGAGVVRGYLHQPDLTQEKFLRDPFIDSNDANDRIYATGDVARFLEDGRVDFMGRADHQVKIRGYRVELGEIESRLLDHTTVGGAAAIVREDAPGDQRLVAYVTEGTVKKGAFDEAALKDHCRERLPEYMVPQHILRLPAMPQTPNKKIDRKALPAPSEVEGPGTGEMVAPAGELEKQIADVWCAVLGREQVGVDSNFFDLGGHSLLVVRLTRELKAKLERAVSLTDLYRFPTIRSYVESLESGGVSEQVKASADRGARRRDAMARRRRGRA